MTLAGSQSLPVAAELVERLGWLIRLRWLAVVGVTGYLVVARRVFPANLGLPELYATIGALAVCNLLYGIRLRWLRGPKVHEVSRATRNLARFLLPPPPGGLPDVGEADEAAVFANIQVAVDLMLLAFLLHFSGGIENPFLYFFIFHVIIAAILFSRRATYVHATWAVVLVAAVAIGEGAGVMRHFPLNGAWAGEAYRDPAIVAAQVLVFAATLYLSAYMGSSIADRLRRREAEVVALSREVEHKAETLTVAFERVSQAERAKSQYMRKVAHELRGPLGTIQTALKVVLDGSAGDLPADSRDLVSRAERRSGELAQITADLLALARAREGSHSAELTPVRLDEIAAEVVADAAGGAREAGITLASETCSAPGAMAGDAAGLRQAVANLVGNAIRYTPAGGSVLVRVVAGGGSIRVEVSDTGIGIPEEDVPRIFDEFYRAANARARTAGGTGLGLAIVKAVAEQHGGRVEVASRPGEGSRFALVLPATPSVTSSTPPVPAPGVEE